MYDKSDEVTRKSVECAECDSAIDIDLGLWYHHLVYGGSAELISVCEGQCWENLALGGDVALDEERCLVYVHSGTRVEGYQHLLEEMLWNRGQALVCE